MIDLQFSSRDSWHAKEYESETPAFLVFLVTLATPAVSKGCMNTRHPLSNTEGSYMWAKCTTAATPVAAPDMSSVDSKGLSHKTCEVLVRINKQSPDIAGGVHIGKGDLDIGAGDQGIMFGYATDETEDCTPLTHSVATKLGKKFTDGRKSGNRWWLRPDGKTQVTIQYLQEDDGSMEPQKSHTAVISTQHAEHSKATRCKEVAGYTGPDATPPSMEEMNKFIVDEVVKKTLDEIILKNGKFALTLFDDSTHPHINPSGKFITGGPQRDAGLAGRMIIIDKYGGWGAHGGGAFSGKDPTKADCSAAYATAMQVSLRRMGRIIENAPGNIALQLLSPPGATAVVTTPASELDPWAHGNDSWGAAAATITADFGTDTDNASTYGEADCSETHGMTPAQVDELLPREMQRHERNWRAHTKRQPTREVRRALKRKIKGKGAGEGKD